MIQRPKMVLLSQELMGHRLNPTLSISPQSVKFIVVEGKRGLLLLLYLVIQNISMLGH